MNPNKWKWMGIGIILFFSTQIFESAAIGENSKRVKCPDQEFGCASISDQIRIVTILDDFIGGAKGAELAVAQRGTLFGRDILLENLGHGCDFDGVSKVAKKITHDKGIAAVIGTSCSGAAGLAVPILSEAGYLTVSPSNTATFLTAPATHASFYLRTIFPDIHQGTAMAEFARNELDPTPSTAAIIYLEEEYPLELRGSFADQFEKLGGTITAEVKIETPSNPESFDETFCDTLDFTSLINSLGNPDFIYMPIFNPDGACLTKQLRQMNYAAPVGAPDSLFDPFVFDVLGTDPLSFYVSGTKHPSGPLYDQFVQDYISYFGSEPESDYEGYGYDAANLILNAMAQVGVEERPGSKNGDLWIPRGALRDAMYATENYPGVTGTLTCNENGDCNLNSVGIFQAAGGEFTRILPQ